MPNGYNRPQDPLLIVRFKVTINEQEVASFSEISGIECEVELKDELSEGGNTILKFPTGVRYKNLTLKRGLANSGYLWDWFMDTTLGRVRKNTITVTLIDQQGHEVWDWTFKDAFPVKWVGPTLKADSSGASALAIEMLELTHQGLSGGPRPDSMLGFMSSVF